MNESEHEHEEFSQSEFLEKHKLFKHEGLGYNCNSCNHSNNTLEGLLKYKSSKRSVQAEKIELNEAMNSKIKQAIQCEICSKLFACNEGLKRHKNFKQDSFGYNCDKCDYAARSSLGLLKHKSYTHGIISKHKNKHLKDTKEFIFEKPLGSN